MLSCYFRGTIGSVFHFLLLSFLFVLTFVISWYHCRIDWRGINFASEWCIDIYTTTACLLHTLWELFHPKEVLKNILTYAILEPQQLELGADAGSYGSGRSKWTLFSNRSEKRDPTLEGSVVSFREIFWNRPPPQGSFTEASSSSRFFPFVSCNCNTVGQHLFLTSQEHWKEEFFSRKGQVWKRVGPYRRMASCLC